MFVWIGIDVDNQLEEVKAFTRRAEESIGFDHSNFTLPFHISLKTSFEVDSDVYPHVIDTILDYFEQIEPFDVDVSGIEYHDTIVWIRMSESLTVNRIHDDLDRIMLERFGVPRHEYDLDYMFHTTLFMDENKQKISKAYERVKDASIPSRLHARKLLIGASETGALGTYKVTHVIDI